MVAIVYVQNMMHIVLQDHIQVEVLALVFHRYQIFIAKQMEQQPEQPTEQLVTEMLQHVFVEDMVFGLSGQDCVLGRCA